MLKSPPKANETSGRIRLNLLTPSFGAEVYGIDLRDNIAADVALSLQKSLLEHQVLLFRQQRLNEEQQLAFSQLFGTCQIQVQSCHFPATNKYIRYLSNVNTDGMTTGHHPDPDSAYWHIDGSHSKKPYKATVLYALQVPDVDGYTEFADLYQACEDIEFSTRRSLEKKIAEHHIGLSRAARYKKMPWQWCQDQSNKESLGRLIMWWLRLLATRQKNRPTYHPVIRNHPETGRPVLFIGDHAWRIRGYFWPVGIRLMREINSLNISSQAMYRHFWKSGDLIIWDNQSILHRVGPYDLDNQIRIMRRCVVL